MIGVKQRGFTLVEMIITVAIFALSFVAITAIYVGVTNAQSKAKEEAFVLNETQFMFEQIAREIRGKEVINSGGICNCSGAEGSYICLKDLGNNHTFFRHNVSQKDLEVHRGFSCTTGTWVRLNDSSIDITNLQFKEVATDLSLSDRSLTTVIMTVENHETSPRRKAEINLQTTISSRIYGG